MDFSNHEGGPKKLATIREEQHDAPESPKFGPANPSMEEEKHPQESSRPSEELTLAMLADNPRQSMSKKQLYDVYD